MFHTVFYFLKFARFTLRVAQLYVLAVLLLKCCQTSMYEAIHFKDNVISFNSFYILKSVQVCTVCVLHNYKGASLHSTALVNPWWVNRPKQSVYPGIYRMNLFCSCVGWWTYVHCCPLMSTYSMSTVGPLLVQQWTNTFTVGTRVYWLEMSIFWKPIDVKI